MQLHYLPAGKDLKKSGTVSRSDSLKRRERRAPHCWWQWQVSGGAARNRSFVHCDHLRVTDIPGPVICIALEQMRSG